MTMAIVDRIRAGSAAFGVTLTIHDPFVAEVMAAQQFDFLMIDSEHSPISADQLQIQLIALRSASATVLVRVAHLEPAAIMQLLDLGADGVVVPHVESALDVAAAVDAAFYPPMGARGIGPRRAGRLVERAPYLARANDETIVVIMIETRLGIDNLEHILDVPGVGGVIVGAADLAASLGHLGDPGHPEVAKAIDQIFAGCRAAEIPFGIYAASPEEAQRLVHRGAQIITVGSDLLFLEKSMRATLAGLEPVDRGTPRLTARND